MQKKLKTRSGLAVGLSLAAASACAAEPAAPAADIFKTAVAVWHMADLKDSAGQNGLAIVGNATVGNKLEGQDLQESLACGNDGVVAELDGGYLDAGQGAGGALNVTGSALTVSVRLRNPSGVWGTPLFSKHGGHDQLVYNLYSLPNVIGFELGTQGAAGASRTTVPVAKIGASAWHTVICRYDGTRLQMFVDGVLMDENFPKGPLREGNSVPCLIGAESVGGNIKAGWKGQIDHVALWKRALSDAEIERLSGGAERIAAARKRFEEIPVLPPRPDLYQEKYRPQFHFTARQWTLHKLNPGMREEGWINDLNGLLHYEGEYHLFAQRWAKCWLHAVSTDLVHWTELQPAFWEDNRFGTGVQSGGAVIDHRNTSGLSPDPKTPPMVAFWSGFDNFNTCISYSLDKGRTWTKYAKNPVLRHPERDPKVFWHEPSKHWVLVLSGGGAYFIFTSPNLLDWTEMKEPIPHSFECPDMFQLPVAGAVVQAFQPDGPAGKIDLRRQKWVLVRGNGNYSLGEFDGARFDEETGQFPCDQGANFYATMSWGDIAGQPGRRVQVAWMRCTDKSVYPDMPFNQQITFPCDLTLRSFPEGLRICRLPAAEIESLYGKKHAWKDQAVKPGENLLKDVSGDLFDIQLQADLAGAKEFGIKCRGAAVTYSSVKGTLACLGKEARTEAANGLLTLRILVDRTSLEVFANDGKVSMSSCFLPKPEDAGLELFSAGASPKILSMTVYELKSAWGKAGQSR
ncbi:MAG: GH32 C-terminal domain-containing protein [Planctomycetota bacterium]